MGLQRVFTDIAANSWSAARLVPIRKRWIVLRSLGMDVKEAVVLPGCYFGGTDIHIGVGSFISNNCYFDNAASIYIGDGVDVGPNVQFITGTHEIGPSRRRAGALSNAPITVHDGAWIGAGVTIQPGVTIGAGAIVNAGSLVTKDVAADSLYRGVPAEFVRRLH